MNPTPSKTEQEFFDQHVHENGDFNPFTDRGWATLRKRFSDALGKLAAFSNGEVSLLDIGCGTGQSKRIYDGAYSSYTGLDLSSVAISIAQENFGDANWVVGDACNLPFENEQFEIVAFSSLLHHIPKFGAALEEGYRVLKPGGIAFAFDPNLLHPAMALLRHPSSLFYLSAGVSPNERPLLPSALRESFNAAGFTDISQRCQSDLPYRKVAPAGVNAFLSVYNALDWFWERSKMSYAFGTFVITSARKPS